MAYNPFVPGANEGANDQNGTLNWKVLDNGFAQLWAAFSGGGGGGDATAANQVLEITQLELITTNTGNCDVDLQAGNAILAIIEGRLLDGNGVSVADVCNLIYSNLNVITGQAGTPEYYGGNVASTADAGAAMAAQIAAIKGNYATCFVSAFGIVPLAGLGTYDWYMIILI